MKTLYKSKWILPGNRIVLENGAIFIENGRILDVLNQEKLSVTDLTNCEVIDFGNSVITPGFINLHTHLQYTQIGKKKPKKIFNRIKRLFLYLRKFLIFGKKQNSFVSWIINLIIEYFCWTEQEKQESFIAGLKQVLLSGTTCIAQLSTEELYFEILNSSPIKSYIFLEVYADSAKSAESNFELFREKYEKLNQKRSQSTFLGVSPHSIYNVHKDLWKKIAEYSRKNNILIHIHFAESKEEMKWIKTGNSDILKLHDFVGCKRLKPFEKGLDSVSFLKKLELPNENVILAHVNQLQEGNYNELAGMGVSIAHCPRSNMILHNITININQALKAFKSRIGIGTDSLYSNYDLNIINEAEFVLKEGVDVLTVLDMLTITPARILKIDYLTGSLEKGKDADFLVFSLKNKEKYTDFIKKKNPDYVYISGSRAV